MNIKEAIEKDENLNYKLKVFEHGYIKRYENCEQQLFFNLCKSLIQRYQSLNKLKDYEWNKYILYTQEKEHMLPEEVTSRDEEFVQEILIAHDRIIEHCQYTSPERLNFKLIEKLMYYYDKKIPFWAQLKYFEDTIKGRIKQDAILDIMINEKSYIDGCRKVYCKTLNVKDTIIKNLESLGVEVKE